MLPAKICSYFYGQAKNPVPFLQR